jgi:hypothetical protein
MEYDADEYWDEVEECMESYWIKHKCPSCGLWNCQGIAESENEIGWLKVA